MTDNASALKQQISSMEEKLKSATDDHAEAMKKLKESVTEGYIQMQTKAHVLVLSQNESSF